jgi:hypothetical protein
MTAVVVGTGVVTLIFRRHTLSEKYPDSIERRRGTWGGGSEYTFAKTDPTFYCPAGRLREPEVNSGSGESGPWLSPIVRERLDGIRIHINSSDRQVANANSGWFDHDDRPKG